MSNSDELAKEINMSINNMVDKTTDSMYGMSQKINEVEALIEYYRNKDIKSQREHAKLLSENFVLRHQAEVITFFGRGWVAEAPTENGFYWRHRSYDNGRRRITEFFEIKEGEFMIYGELMDRDWVTTEELPLHDIPKKEKQMVKEWFMEVPSPAWPREEENELAKKDSN